MAERTFTLRILRGRSGGKARFETYRVRLPERAYVLDAVEQIWAEQDPTLLFRRACHHASCGTCGARINGREALMCVTPLADFPEERPIQLEPLRNLPWYGDLLVDPRPFAARMEEVDFPLIRRAEAPPEEGIPPEELEGWLRFEDCIECGLCVSACPVAGSDPYYLGPAALAAVARLLEEPRGRDPEALLRLIDDEHGLWRCHGAMECTAVCPSSVDPAGRIGALRRRLILERRGAGRA